MPIFRLTEAIAFPDPERADDETGILAVGGDLRPERLLLAYSIGVFPWFNSDRDPILWHSPAERMVLLPGELSINRSLRKALRRRSYHVRYDTAFGEVVRHCASVPRDWQAGTWITPKMQRAYQTLHERGCAHSAEAWEGDRLVGGLYGVALGGAFFGESMFSLEPDASKVVFVTCVQALAAAGFRLIDCQVHTEHLERFGAREWPRRLFLRALREALAVRPSPPWPLDPGPLDPGPLDRGPESPTPQE